MHHISCTVNNELDLFCHIREVEKDRAVFMDETSHCHQVFSMFIMDAEISSIIVTTTLRVILRIFLLLE